MGLLDISLDKVEKKVAVNKPKLNLKLNLGKKLVKVEDEPNALNKEIEATEVVEIKPEETENTNINKVNIEDMEEETSNLDDFAKEPEEDKEEVQEEEPVEEVKEEAKSKKRKTKKKAQTKEAEAVTKTKDEAVEVTPEQIQTVHDILGNKTKYDKSCDMIFDFFNDDEWNEEAKEITEELANIRIEADMNPGTLRYLLSELNIFNDKIRPRFNRHKQILESLTDKDFGIASVHKAVHSTGSNEADRKKNGALALLNADFNGEKINYVKVIAAARMRYDFYEDVVNRIEFKSRICNTLLGALKVEANLLPGAI